MKMHTLKEISTALNKDGIFIHRDFERASGVDVFDIEAELKVLDGFYSKNMVKNNTFREQEAYVGRTGNACMTSIGETDKAPFLQLNGKFKNLFRLQMFYNDICSFHTKLNFTDSASLLNWQHYEQGLDNSIPMHMDCELLSGNWGKDGIDIKEAIIPKFVMVYVTTNENDGYGLKVTESNTSEDLENIKLHRGDLIIFDNTACLHGVPNSTVNERKMVGFRNFELGTLLFKDEEFDGSVPYQNGQYKGFSKELSQDEARTLLVKKGLMYD